MKNQNLKYFCDSCNNGILKILELKLLINRLLAEVSELRKPPGNNLSSRFEEFIINELNE